MVFVEVGLYKLFSRLETLLSLDWSRVSLSSATDSRRGFFHFHFFIDITPTIQEKTTHILGFQGTIHSCCYTSIIKEIFQAKRYGII